MSCKQQGTNGKGGKRASESWNLAMQGGPENRWQWAMQKAVKDYGEKTPEAGVQIHTGTDLTGSLIHSTNICETSTTCQAQHTGYRGELRGPS